ncbi:MAG TPA: DUF2752 domain-containing protein [Terriglobia bacterium]|nr:DUF2752 domain-containing protein [Terriglobia bacterium]
MDQAPKLPLFASGIPRLALLLVTLAVLCLVPPELLARGPNLCLWCHLFRIKACPSCGTTRALAALFHGHFTQALAFNRNVIATGPGLVALTAADAVRFLRRVLC